MPKSITKPDDPARPYLVYQVEQVRDQLTTMQFRFDQDTLAFSTLALAVCALTLAAATVATEADGRHHLGDVGFALAWLKGKFKDKEEVSHD